MQLVLPMERDGRPLLRSKMILRAEKLGETAGEDFSLQLVVKGRALAKKDWFGKSDPYMQFCRLRPDGTFDIVYVTPQYLQMCYVSLLLPSPQTPCSGTPLKSSRTRLIPCGDLFRSRHHN
jgi:hypothetical protein